SVRAISRRRCGSGCGHSRCRRPQPSVQRSCAARSPSCAHGSPSSISRRSTNGWPRPTSARPRPASRAAPRRRSSKPCSPRAAEAARVAAVERETRFERARQALARLLAAERVLRDAVLTKLDELLAGRAAIEAELTGAAGEREAALSVSYELRSRAARLAVQRESATRLSARLRAELADAEADAARPGPSPEELEQQALYARAEAREAAHERDTLAERALTAQERLATLERSLAEREGIPPAARALAEQGERLLL